ncbi:glycosyltransferase family 2 protein [Methylobacterium sp. J-068]|uniref:glycosyltransferase family 2 protein n=1 Tax=Methylobacterium sp. J-068 TaxID=2836649 RepID=UPI001FBB4019|nr:glycosyltransferase [Methylobacterium sp. J-068]MCJ2036381.1 glycosyltransferase [Methylobacterium sp. J-068]
MTEPALRFAAIPEEHPRDRWLRTIRALALAPREAAAILRARLSGKRVRARQALAALVGLDHRGLWSGPGRLAGRPAPVPASEASAVDIRLASELERAGSAPLLILTAPGHTLLPGAVALIQAAFADDPTRQALYGDALLLRADGAAMPLLRPAFDRDYLMAVDYIGPVVALRRSGLAALAARAAVPPPEGATDLILRLADHFGAGTIGHLPRLLSQSGMASTGPNDPHRDTTRRASDPEGEGGHAPHRAVIRRALDRTGHSDVAIEVGPDGVLTLRHPLPPERPLVSLIVPTRDRLDLLRPCIASLSERTDWPAREILICDNDSREPETHAYFRDLAGRGLARIVACPGPFDFAAMNNAAARAARGRVLAFVNNDVAAIHPDWLERMVRVALRPDVGAVGAKLIDGQGRIQHGGVLLGPGGLVTHAHRFFPGDALGYLGSLSATRAVSAVTAACLVVEADKFAEVHGFDGEAFAVDFNDVDLCLRLDRAGYRTLFVPGAVLHHFEAASRRWTPQARERHLREVAAFKKRWGPLLAQDPHYHPGFDPDLGTHARLRLGWPETGPVSPR